VRPEGYGKLEKFITSLGLEPTTFQLVAQRLRCRRNTIFKGLKNKEPHREVTDNNNHDDLVQTQKRAIATYL
jgi:hypothetical protein